MIDFDGFGRLRAGDYIAEDELEWRDSWEFLGCVWLGWGSGFTDFLTTYDEPDVTRCISIDLDDLPAATAARLLRDIDIPLRPGMDLSDVREVLGDPVREVRYVADRVSYEFHFNGYNVDTTILNDGGLTYLVIHPPLPPKVDDE